MNTENYFIDCGISSVSSSQESRPAEKLVSGQCVEAMNKRGINSVMVPGKNTKRKTQAKYPRNSSPTKHKINLKKKTTRNLMKKSKPMEKALKKKTVALKKTRIEKDQSKPYPVVEEVLPRDENPLPRDQNENQVRWHSLKEEAPKNTNRNLSCNPYPAAQDGLMPQQVPPFQPNPRKICGRPEEEVTTAPSPLNMENFKMGQGLGPRQPVKIMKINKEPRQQPDSDVQNSMPPQVVPCDDQLSRSQGLQNDSYIYGKKVLVSEEVKSLDQITSCKAESIIHIPQNGISDSLQATIPSKPKVQYVTLNKDYSRSKVPRHFQPPGTSRKIPPPPLPRAKSILKCKTNSYSPKPQPRRNKISLKKGRKVRAKKAKKALPKRNWLSRWIWPSNTNQNTSQ